MRRTWQLVVVALLWPARILSADSEAGKPYEFQVLVQFGSHRLLTPTFRQRLTDDVRDGLQAALGALAEVQVADADGPARKDWRDPAAVDTAGLLGPIKRHFLHVDFVDGQVVVRARQHDGSTGQNSPLMRQTRTSDARFVSRQLLRFIQEDFGAVGTVMRAEGTRVWLQLRGGAVPEADVGRWVPARSVFALVQLRSDGVSAEAVQASYLRTVAAPVDGQVECEMFSRFENPLRFWPQSGYRAIRLGTTNGPVRLRITDPNGLPQAGLQVRVSANSFKFEEIRERGTIRDGSFETSENYSGLALVTIASGGLFINQVPVPILDQRPVEISVHSAAADAAKDTIEIEAVRERRALHDIYRRLIEQNRQLAGLLKERNRNREVLDRLQTWLELLDQECFRHTTEVWRLRGEAKRVTASIGPVLDDCDGFLKEIRKVRDDLQKIEASLKADQAVAASPEAQEKRDTVSALMRKVDLHLEAAEFEEAIETYKEILAHTGEREDIRAKLDDLEKAWKTKGADHEQARRFAYTVWPKITTLEDVRKNLPLAREKFEVCKLHRDRLTAKKLFLVATEQAIKILLDALADVRSSDSDVASLLTKQIDVAKADLEGLIKDLREFLEKPEIVK